MRVAWLWPLLVMAKATCDDSVALGKLFTATSGLQWKNKTGWPPTPYYCNGASYGVTCDANNCTTQLRLDSNQLNGTIPTEIGSLKNLTTLNLYSNQLSGTIPTEIGLMQKLSYLWLNINLLNGTIPTEIGSLQNLTSLGLNVNLLNGTIPTGIGSLKNLEELYLYSNQLSGTIPTEIGLMQKLSYLNLYSNQLSGTIPTEIGLMQKLSHLWLNINLLNGTIPTGIGSLQNLTSLGLNINLLNGTIPTEIGSLKYLEELYLYRNQLSGTIPTEIGLMQKLSYLYLQQNQLCGAMPNTYFPSSLNVSDNFLNGTIPQSLTNRTNLLIANNCFDLQCLANGTNAGNQNTCPICANVTCISNWSACKGVPTIGLPNPTTPGLIPMTPAPGTPGVVTPPPAVRRADSEPLKVFGGSAAANSIVSTAFAASGNPGMVVGAEMCLEVPGRNNKLLMPFPATEHLGFTYNLIIHSLAGVTTSIIGFKVLPLSGIGWSVFQIVTFGIVLNSAAAIRRGVEGLEAAAICAGVLCLAIGVVLNWAFARKTLTHIEWFEVDDPLEHRGAGYVHSAWRGTPTDQEDGGESELNDGDTEEDQDISDQMDTLYSDEIGAKGGGRGDDSYLYEVEDNGENPNQKFADKTKWLFVSRLWYFTLLRYAVCCGVPALIVVTAGASCAGLSIALCLLTIAWTAWVVLERPHCSDVGVLSEILSSGSTISVLIPRIFNLPLAPFSAISMVVSFIHFGLSVVWLFLYRRIYKEIIETVE